jgi:hypothetical protein
MVRRPAWQGKSRVLEFGDFQRRHLMLRLLIAGLGLALSSTVWAEACVVHSQGNQVQVKLCQQNRSIPTELFRSGFCQPQLKGQKVEVSFVEQCPAGAFGVCRNAATGGTPYRQDIHYYGTPSDARLLKPYCEKQSTGVWMAP